jgi:hypothetical protein
MNPFGKSSSSSSKPPFSFVRDVVPMTRMCSSVVTDQGPVDGTCFAHSIAKMMSRFFKFHFSRDFKSETERYSDFYDMFLCGKKHTIFECIDTYLDHFDNNRKEFLPGVDGEAQRDGEIMSALLFHYIYNSMLIDCDCTGDFLEKAISIALYKLTLTPVLSSVKDILRYQVYYEKKHPQPPLYDPLVEEVNVYLQYLYLTLQEISSAIQTSHFKPILGRSIDLGIFQEYKKTGQQYLPGKTSKKFWLEDLDAIINGKRMYAIIGVGNHAVTIIGMTPTELIIKDSRKDMAVEKIFVMPAGIETLVMKTEEPQIFKLDIAKLTAYKDYKDPVLNEQPANICIMYLDAEVDSSKPLQRKIDRMSSRPFNSRASMAELVKEQMELTKRTIQEQQQQQLQQSQQLQQKHQ